MAEIDLETLTVATAQQGFATGRLTAESLAEASLARIARLNPSLNAIITPNPQALADARAIDRRRAQGETLPPLAGIPVVIKDPMDMAGLPTTGGWSLLHAASGGTALIPEHDSPVVARMREAGAVMLGKTNVPVLSASGTHANDSWAGPTHNAAAPGRAPGASSSGTATAVAAAMCILGLAEETGGSIQNPASAQALVGIKPTHGLVPNAGVLPLSSMRDVVGPIARNVRDAAICLDVLAGFTLADPKTAAAIGRIPQAGYAAALEGATLHGARLGLYGPGWRDAPLAPETAALYTRAQHELAHAGATLVDDPFHQTGFAAIALERPPGSRYDSRGLESLPYDMEQYLRRLGPAAPFRGFAHFAEAVASQDPFAEGARLGYLPALPGFQACRANPTQPPDMRAFADLRSRYLHIFQTAMDAQGLDALAFPQMREPLPPLHGDRLIQATTVSEINIAGLPGIVVPAGYHEDGAPFCLILVGRPWSEPRLLALAHAYEQATRHRRAPVLTT
jgi:amidase